MGLKGRRGAKKWNLVVSATALFVVLLTSFNNCSKTQVQSPESSTVESVGDGSLTGEGSKLCDDSLKALFANGYHKFVRTNCASCHATSNDAPQFANPDVNWAYKVFNERGYNTLSNRAVSNHQPPYTGVQQTQAVNELRLEWRKGISDYNTCMGQEVLVDQIDPIENLALETSIQPIGFLAIEEEKRLVWDIEKDIKVMDGGAALTGFGSGKFAITITRQQTAGGEDFYTFSRPTIYENEKDIRIKTIYVRLNRRILSYPTTFKFVNTAIRKGALDDITGRVTTGALTAPGAVSDRDEFSVLFETLEPTELPPLSPPVMVNFQGPEIVIADATTGIVKIPVAIAEKVFEPLVVTMEADTSPVCGTNEGAVATISSDCLPNLGSALTAAGVVGAQDLRVRMARSRLGSGSVSRFDWDYQLSESTVNFLGDKVSAEFTLRLSKDVRHEDARLLKLDLNLTSNAGVLGSKKQILVYLRKRNNPIPAVGEITFSALMSSKGILNLNCVHCHNTEKLEGGYDMTDYELMLSRGVLIPSDPMSKMFRRMDANNPMEGFPDPMPRDGYMDLEKILIIKDWILKGAKNN